MTAPDASTALLVGKNVAESAPVNKSRKILYLVLGLLVGAFIGSFSRRVEDLYAARVHLPWAARSFSLSDLKEGGLLLSVGDMISSLINDPNDSSEKPWEAEGQHLEEGEILYFSFAPIVKGGSEVLTSKFQLYKNYISTADFLDRENGLPNPRKSNIAKYGDLFGIGDEDMMDSILNQRGVRIIEGNVFEIDGIRFGMEICLDDRMGVLWENLQQDNSSLVDVHLITSRTSAGMSIERGPTNTSSSSRRRLPYGWRGFFSCMSTHRS
ncbi:hypothetical protein IV203_009348 [Nitzschia inconspicua]|uniref:Uncharacterized protein n=1 Tax=Nitzschia inconspicua TaxID=303405 RepID=A0A9K3L0C1_9STRA|nr:hypothetical protein IV203_009348 [Nitzschia inconspicua]